MIPNIYHPNPLSVGETVELSENAARHCLKVLRIKEGQPINLFCGDGYRYRSEIVKNQGRGLVKVLEKTAFVVESPLAIELAQGLTRHDRMDWIIQKAVECGVQGITPLMMEKSIVKLKADRLDHKMQHWHQILIAACEQSGRTQLPTLHKPVPLKDWLLRTKNLPGIVFDPRGETSVKAIAPTPQLRVLLGPESGLSQKELKTVQDSDFTTCHLGPRILRTETATIGALISLQTVLGDF